MAVGTYTSTVKRNDNNYFCLSEMIPQQRYIQARQQVVGFLPRFRTETKKYMFFLNSNATEAVKSVSFFILFFRQTFGVDCW